MTSKQTEQQVKLDAFLEPARLQVDCQENDKSTIMPNSKVKTPGPKPGKCGPEDNRKRSSSHFSPQGDSPDYKVSKAADLPAWDEDDDGDENDEADAALRNGETENRECAQSNVPIICDPVLSYIVFALQKGTVENVRKAVLCHFSMNQIAYAKCALWDTVDDQLLGKLQCRRSTKNRTEEEANIYDILNAITKLDKSGKMPVITIKAMDLGLIPRSHPEELNNISLVDRLARIEKKIEQMQECVGKNEQNIQELKSAGEKSGNSETDHSRLTATNEPGSGSYMHNRSAVHAPAIHVEDSIWNVNASRADKTKADNIVSEHVYPYKHALGLTHRAGHVSRDRGFGYGHNLHTEQSNVVAQPSALGLRGSNISLATNNSVDSEGFKVVKNKKKVRRDRRVVTGQKLDSSCIIKGAPEPNRDLFISRLVKETKDSDLERYVRDSGFTVNDLECISHPDAKMKSFRMSVPKSEFPKLLSDSLWPSGVRVRKYIPPPKEDRSVNK